MQTLEAKCTECGGCGIKTSPRTRKESLGVICKNCGGTGKVTIHYEPFKRKKRVSGIRQVTRTSAGLGAVGFGSLSGPRISYEEFMAGKMPPEALTIIK